MISTKIPMTAQAPSLLGMPTSGHATSASTLGRSAAAITAAAACPVVVDAVVREREAGIGFVQGYFPGTSAWRPPSC